MSVPGKNRIFFLTAFDLNTHTHTHLGNKNNPKTKTTVENPVQDKKSIKELKRVYFVSLGAAAAEGMEELAEMFLLARGASGGLGLGLGGAREATLTSEGPYSPDRRGVGWGGEGPID